MLPVTLYQRHLSSVFCPASPSFPNIAKPFFPSFFCFFSWLCFCQNQNKPISPAVTNPCTFKPEQLFLIATSEDVGGRKNMCSLLDTIDKPVAGHTVSLKHIHSDGVSDSFLGPLLPWVHSSVIDQNPTHDMHWASFCAEGHSAWERPECASNAVGWHLLFRL